VVAELLATDKPITQLFHASLHWQEIAAGAAEVGWVVEGDGFAPPPPPVAHDVPVNLSTLQAQVTALGVRIAALQGKA